MEIHYPALYAEGSLLVGRLTGWLHLVLEQDGGEGLRVRRVTTGRTLYIYPHVTEPFKHEHENALAVRTGALAQ